MSFRKPCHMPFHKLIPPLTLTEKSRLRSKRSRAQILPAPSPSASPFNANPTTQPTKICVPFTFHPDFPENFGKWY